ncbi:MAG: response regulator, partial [Spirochaetales bacterium]|nr:response regulator [Spirochaetales bacterium]
MKILIVDDEVNIRETIIRILELEGHTAESAENGLSAQRLMGEHYYDLAVIDLKMPGMDGLELLDWIKQEELN